MRIPNQTLTKNWYKGHRSITMLYLNKVDIRTIDKYAFLAIAFYSLEELWLFLTHHIEWYEFALFTPLKSLKGLYIREASGAGDNFPSALLRPVSKKLNIFAYEGASTSESVLSKLFGLHKLSRLFYVNYECTKHTRFSARRQFHRTVSHPNVDIRDVRR